MATELSLVGEGICEKFLLPAFSESSIMNIIFFLIGTKISKRNKDEETLDKEANNYPKFPNTLRVQEAGGRSPGGLHAHTQVPSSLTLTASFQTPDTLSQPHLCQLEDSKATPGPQHL